MTRIHRKVGVPRKPSRSSDQSHPPARRTTAIARRQRHYPEWYGKVLEDQKNGLRDLKIQMSTREIESAQRRFKSALERKSPETIRSYQSAARSFGRYIGIVKAKPSDVIARLIILSRIEAETLVEAYIKWMDEDEELAPSTINLYLAALKFFVRTARRVGWCEWQLDVDGLKNSIIKDVEGVSPEELLQILDLIGDGNDKHALRLRMIIFMLAFIGLRISSILTLDLEHIDFEKRGAWFKMKGERAKRVFKTIPPITFETIEEWVEEFRGEEEGPLVINFTNGKRLRRQSVDKKLKEIGAKLGLERPLHAHSFRHFVATEGLEMTDGNRHKVMRLTEHSSDKMLERYDDKRLDLGGQLSKDIEAKFLISKGMDEEEDEDDNDVDVISAASIDDMEDELEKTAIGYEPLDIVLDGGISEGQVIALAGAPGLGKSTVLQHGGGSLARRAGKVLYVSGEQGQKDLVNTLRRLDIRARRLLIMHSTRLETVVAKAKKLGVMCLIVDSINCMVSDVSRGQPGGSAQMKSCSDALIRLAKAEQLTVFVVCHVTKDGDISGPRAVEHLVDTVLHFEGEASLPPRIIKASKNRFGATTSRGYMKMTDKGLIPYEGPGKKNKRKSFE